MPSFLHESTPKRTVPAVFAIVEMQIDNETDSPKPVPPRALPKSIFANVETHATSSIQTLTKRSTSLETINVAKSIFRSVDFLAASACPKSTSLEPLPSTDNQFNVHQQGKAADTFEEERKVWRDHNVVMTDPWRCRIFLVMPEYTAWRRMILMM